MSSTTKKLTTSHSATAGKQSTTSSSTTGKQTTTSSIDVVTSLASSTTNSIKTTTPRKSVKSCPRIYTNVTCESCPDDEYCYEGSCISIDRCPCVFNEVIYKADNIWKNEAPNCTVCSCFNHQVKCARETCEKESKDDCPLAETYVKEEGECCGTCKCLCKENEFRCPGEGCNCIPQWQVCDGIFNCLLGEDEGNCNITTTNSVAKTTSSAAEVTSINSVEKTSSTTAARTEIIASTDNIATTIFQSIQVVTTNEPTTAQSTSKVATGETTITQPTSKVETSKSTIAQSTSKEVISKFTTIKPTSEAEITTTLVNSSSSTNIAVSTETSTTETTPMHTTPTSGGCHYLGFFFPTNGTRRYHMNCGVCVCREDNTWHCDDSNCSSECIMFPGNNFYTFDNFMFDYPICAHTLAKDCTNNTFEIIITAQCENQLLPETCYKTLYISTDNEINLILHNSENLTIDDMWYDFKFIPDLNDHFKHRSYQMRFEYAGGVLIVETDHFQVYWKIATQEARIVIDRTLQGKMCGLCSNGDRNPDNELQLPNGQLTESTKEFGDSWATLGQHCDRTTPNCTAEEMNNSRSICSGLWNEVFEQCQYVLDVNKFYEACMISFCDCSKSTSENDCKCSAMADYAESCQRLLDEPLISSWRYHFGCEHKCPDGKVWKECGTSCPKTCANMMTYNEEQARAECQLECVSGCYCQDGMVLNGNECVLPETCEECVCIGWGDPHYHTYDEKYFAFQGNCTYVLSRPQRPFVNGLEDDFLVLGHNVECTHDPTTTCTEAITVIYVEQEVTLKRNGKVALNGDEIALPLKTHGIQVKHQLLKLILEIDAINLYVEFSDANNGFAVKLPIYHYFNETEGLCGNCNKDPKDDSIKKDGELTSDINDFGYSWFVEFGDECKEKNETSCTPGEPGCCNNISNTTMCDVLYSKTFEECHYIVNVETFHISCRFDVCNDMDGCAAIAKYADECKRKGVCLDWRKEGMCEINCPSGLTYKECGNSCLETCDNITSCSIDGGCFCPDGLLYYNGECIQEPECPICKDENGTLRKEGDQWHFKGDPCGPKCSCESTGETRCWLVGCPIHQVSCKEDEQVVYHNDSTGCCKYPVCVKCEPDDCKDNLSTPRCVGEGMELVVESITDCCPHYKCLCNASSCPIPTPPVCEADMVPVANNSACCPVYECKCPESCPSNGTKNKVPHGQKLVNIKEGACCPYYIPTCDYEQCEDTDLACAVPMIAQISIDPNNTCCNKTYCSCDTSLCPRPLECGLHQTLKLGEMSQCCGREESCICNCPAPPTCGLGTSLHVIETDDVCNCSTYRCVKDKCVINSTVYEDGEQWIVDDCTHCRCNSFTVLCTEVLCPPISENCTNVVPAGDGCCKKCEEVQPQLKCEPKVVITKQLEIDDCKSEQQFNITKCVGSCESSTIYSLASSMMQKQCSCCSPYDFTNIPVKMHCTNGTVYEHLYELIETCECATSQCSSP